MPLFPWFRSASLAARKAGFAVGATLLLGVLLLSGCGALERTSRAPDLVLASGPVAVMPFENLSGNPNAAAIVAELFQAELYAVGVKLVPAEQVAAKSAATAAADKPMTASTDKTTTFTAVDASAVAVPRLPSQWGVDVGARFVAVGRVTEYAYKRSLGEEPAVGVSIRLIDVATGAVVWSGARSDVAGVSPFTDDGLSRLTQDVMQHLARSLAQK